MTTPLLILLAALQLGDWWTTHQILKLGGYEKNPLIRRLMAHLGTDGALAFKTAAVMLIGVLLTFLWWPFLAILCAFYAYIVVSNLVVLRRLFGRK